MCHNQVTLATRQVEACELVPFGGVCDVEIVANGNNLPDDRVMRRKLLPLLTLVACGGDNKKTPDAPPPFDAPSDAAIDSPAAGAPDPVKYCTDIIAHCTGANAQYPTNANAMDQCLGTATSFPVGMKSDTSGNTLGCRAYHAGALAIADPVTHCIHSGPAGDQVDKAGTCGDACTSFCNLDIKICGSTDAPLASITPQYQNLAACMAACSNYNKTNKYVLNTTQASPSGDSLACRLFHATNAALYTKMGSITLANAHCGHTGVTQTPGLPCNGVPAP